MGLSRKHKRKALWIGALLMALLVIGCAGIEPYEPHNNREEGPQKGLFTGAEGEFVIFRTTDASQTGDEIDKGSDGTADGEEQETGSKKKTEDNKNGEQ